MPLVVVGVVPVPIPSPLLTEQESVRLRSHWLEIKLVFGWGWALSAPSDGGAGPPMAGAFSALPCDSRNPCSSDPALASRAVSQQRALGQHLYTVACKVARRQCPAAHVET